MGESSVIGVGKTGQLHAKTNKQTNKETIYKNKIIMD